MSRLALVLAALSLAVAGCGGGERDAGQAPVDPADTPAQPQVSPDGPVSVRLRDTGGLGVSGDVELASAGAGRTDVAVQLEAPEGAAFSASIRDGSCEDTGELVHDLGAVEAGGSSLVAEAPLQGVLSSRRAFVLTAGEADVVACADLPQRAG